MAVEPAELRRRIVDEVVGDGFLPGWRVAFAPWQPSLLAVARHRFIPDVVWVDNDGGPPAFMPLRRERDPDQWLRLAYAGDGVVTQVDDGCPSGPGCGGSMPSSSASGPAVVAVMLAALEVGDGHRDEVEAACHWWRDAGSPGADRWWFTVTPDGQRVQLI